MNPLLEKPLEAVDRLFTEMATAQPSGGSPARVRSREKTRPRPIGLGRNGALARPRPRLAPPLLTPCRSLARPRRPFPPSQTAHVADDAAFAARIAELFAPVAGDGAAVPLATTAVLAGRVPSGTLVRYRGLVQDIFDPEYYLGVYALQGEDGADASRWRSGRFRDVAVGDAFPQEQGSVTLERQPVYCVPIPGETQWVQAAVRTAAGDAGTATADEADGEGARGKRPRDQAGDAEMGDVDAGKAGEADADGGGKRAAKEVADRAAMPPPRQGVTSASVQSGEAPRAATFQANHPLPVPDGHDRVMPPCLIKFYGDEGNRVRICDMVEVVGILALDPVYGETGCDETDPFGEELATHQPPASRVPRLHAISWKRLTDANPRTGRLLAEERLRALGEMQAHVLHLRHVAVEALRATLGGDQLAAEYVLLTLVSAVAKVDNLGAPVGNFSLNLTSCGTERPAEAKDAQFDPPVDGRVHPGTCSPYTHPLVAVLEQLAPLLFYLPVTPHRLNTMDCVPKKDYVTNKLRAGLLQLAKGTLVVVDETAMAEGNITEHGVRQLQALRRVVSDQQVGYDFQFHAHDFATDIQFIVLSSHGKSPMLETSAHVRITPERLPALPDEQGLDAETLDAIRAFLALTRTRESTLGEATTQMIEDDFVESRKVNPRITGDNLGHWLTVARLLALSHGETDISPARWQTMKQMEAAREERIMTPPSSANGSPAK